MVFLVDVGKPNMKYKKKGSANQGGATRFKKGQVANPKGRPKGTANRFSIADLAKAIKFVERDKQQTFMAVWIEAAWGNASDMSTIANYMLPKLRSIEGLVGTFEASMDDDTAERIQNKLKERFEQ
ncbi:hypothetical protein LCGC14_0849330 [marine sediment metagenome]|uniref:DUF5681 domain-containing protein n=1 Tax=marine sediment metagenome TaxID=412755 RepID=A0A0F9PAU2_9ZZZZ